MFSPLARGYGTWTGEIELNPDREVTELQLPSIPEDQSQSVHRHGVTVSPRVFRSNTNLSFSSHKEDGELELPKTFVTKKGALLLFTAPQDDIERSQASAKLLHKKKVENLLDCSLKLNTLERLYLSALQFGDLSYYRKDKCSITDPENHWFLKFLHDLDRQDIDISTKPGADVNFYLRDLKTRASQRIHAGGDSTTRRQRSQELRSLLHELEDVWRSKSKSSLKPESSSLSQSKTSPTQRILSSKSLAASIKSSTYLGRADSCATDFSKDGSGKVSGPSPVTLPEISSKHGRRRKASWISPATTSEDLQNTQPVSITRVPTDKRLSSAKSDGSGGRRSAEPRSTSRLSGRSSSNDLDEARSSSADSSRYTEELGDITTIHHHRTLIDSELLTELAENDDGDNFDIEYTTEDEFGRVADKVSTDKAIYVETGDVNITVNNIDVSGEDVTRGIEIGEKDNKTEDGTASKIFDQQQKIQSPCEEGQEDKQYGSSLITGDSTTVLSGEEVTAESQPVGDVDTIQVQHKPKPPPDPRRARLYRLNAKSKKPTVVPPTDQEINQSAVDASLKETDINEEQKPTDGVEKVAGGTENIAEGTEKISDDTTQLENRNDELADGTISVIVEQIPTDSKPVESDNTMPNTDENTSNLNITDVKDEEGANAIEEPNEDSTKVEDKGAEEGEGDKQKDPLAEGDKKETDETQEATDTLTGPEESEESMSFVFMKDNSTTGSASVGKHEPEEDIMEVLERRRRARMLSNLNMESANNFDDMEDDFAERAKEAEKAEQDFIFIREEESDGEAHDPDGPERKSKRSKRKRAPKKPEKVYVKALDITSIAPVVEEEEVKEEENVDDDEGEDKPWVHPNQRFFPDGPLPKLEVPEEDAALPSHLEEMLTRRSASKSAEELENELLQMQDIMNKEMAGSSMTVEEGEEGLTAEELKLAQELLEGRVKEVSSKIFNTGTEEEGLEPIVEVQAKKKSGKGKGKGGKGGKKRPKKQVEPVDRKTSIAEERDSIRQQRKMEKLRRLEEMKELQDKIVQREELRKAQEEEIHKKAKELAEEQEALEEEAAAIKQNEDEAREQLAEIRKKQRLERDTRRKAEQERKRQLAIERREREKVMRDIARQKEKEMLDRIGDAETRRELIAEEDRRIEEEERIADEALQEELRDQQIALEEEEIRMRELEKEAEEEAMQRLIEEREEAERRQRELKAEEERIRQEEEKLRQELLVEEERLREEKRLKELEEQMKLDEERKRLDELKRLEEEARQAMRQELEYKREWAIKRREQNLNRRSHLDKIRIGQGLTRPWVFSYFVLWKKESFSKLIGRDPKTKRGFRLKSKPKDSAPPEPPGSPIPEFMPGLTAIAEE